MKVAWTVLEGERGGNPADRLRLIKNGIMEMNKITREEVLRRYQSTRERKEKRLEEMKEILYKRYVNRTGEEPKYFFAL